MVTGSDSEAGEEVVCDGEKGRLELERNPEGGDQAGKGDEDDEGGIQPVDVLIPVLQCDRLLGDICLMASVVSNCWAQSPGAYRLGDLRVLRRSIFCFRRGT